MYAGNYECLSEQCKSCLHLRVFSARMNGKHSYACGRYPRKRNVEICPEYIVDKVHGIEPKES